MNEANAKSFRAPFFCHHPPELWLRHTVVYTIRMVGGSVQDRRR